MIVGIGTDLVKVARIREVLARHGERFVNRILTDAERVICTQSTDPAAYLAKRFAAKEAASKALGTGIGRIGWRDIAATNRADGAPQLNLTGAAAMRLAELNGCNCWLSLADEQDYVIATVILEA